VLAATLAPGGPRGLFVNSEEICHAVWQRPLREAPHVSALTMPAFSMALAMQATRAVSRARRPRRRRRSMKEKR